MRPYVRAANVTWDGIDLSDVKEMDFDPDEFAAYKLKRGDLLLGEASGSQYEVGKPAIWNDEIRDCCFQNTLIRVRAPESLVPYLHAHFVADARLGNFARAARGVGIHHLGQATLASWQVRVPPLNEQRRIVTKINSLSAHSRAAREALKRVPTLLERFRQSVLAAAFRGHLTAEWRRKRPNVRFEGEVLDGILREHSRTRRPQEAAVEELFHLPPGWRWVRAADVVEPGSVVTYGIVLPGHHVPDGVPYIRGQDIDDEGQIHVQQLLRTSPEIASKHHRSSLAEGDVLLCVIRHLRVAIVPAGVGLDGANLTQGTVRLRPSEAILGSYLAAYLASPIAQNWMKQRYIGMAMPRINVKDARAIPVPVPPLPEQRVIAKYLDECEGRRRKLARLFARAAECLETVDQSILAKAFRGELVSQDPHDEPATTLLERIRDEREAVHGTTNGTRRRRTPAKLTGSGSAPPPDDPPTPRRALETAQASPKKAHARRKVVETVLSSLKRDALHRIADAAGVDLADRRSLAAAQSGLLRADVGLEMVVAHLDRDELKAVCRVLHLEDRGRTKAELRERILDGHGVIGA